MVKTNISQISAYTNILDYKLTVTLMDNWVNHILVDSGSTTPECKSQEQHSVALTLKNQLGKIFQCNDLENKHFIHSTGSVGWRGGEERAGEVMWWRSKIFYYSAGARRASKKMCLYRGDSVSELRLSGCVCGKILRNILAYRGFILFMLKELIIHSDRQVICTVITIGEVILGENTLPLSVFLCYLLLHSYGCLMFWPFTRSDTWAWCCSYSAPSYPTYPRRVLWQEVLLSCRA